MCDNYSRFYRCPQLTFTKNRALGTAFAAFGSVFLGAYCVTVPFNLMGTNLFNNRY